MSIVSFFFLKPRGFISLQWVLDFLLRSSPSLCCHVVLSVVLHFQSNLLREIILVTAMVSFSARFSSLSAESHTHTQLIHRRLVAQSVYCYKFSVGCAAHGSASYYMLCSTFSTRASIHVTILIEWFACGELFNVQPILMKEQWALFAYSQHTHTHTHTIQSMCVTYPVFDMAARKESTPITANNWSWFVTNE